MAEIDVTVRYFAAARTAAGFDDEHVVMQAGAGIDDLVTRLGTSNSELGRVLMRCSFLLDGVAVRDREQPLKPGHTLDVLPPFAGG